ncbi:hypothetical protein ABVK25_007112 [Lepraria finkii]|uniref:Fork-head domain-containing protein n=1 Tax=Lepraria finkii TaxID=1340010 RepID=A0ABR4B3T5_9LECA
MASTRRLEIFQDPGCATETAEMPPQPSYDSMGTAFSDENSQFDPSSRAKIIFNPPATGPSGRSPLKSIRQGRTSPSKALYSNKMNISLPPPPSSTFTTDSPLKKSPVSAYYPIAPHGSFKSIFTTFPGNASADNESFSSDNFAEFPDPSYGSKRPLKRSLSNAGHSQDRPSKKSRVEEPSGLEIPDPENMPLVEDDGKKPPYSYAALIGMSILRAPGRRLTLAQIYKWISDSFSFYRLLETGWQNSIRHNLSLNKAFIKIERPKDDPGKGNYWAIEPGMESQFVKDKNSRRPTSAGGSIMKNSSQPSSEANIWPSQPPTLPKPSLKVIPQEAEVFEPSSDATIPASDAPSSSQEDEVEVINMPPPVSRAALSSPLQPIHSSPPVAHHHIQREDTPSPVVAFALPSGNSRLRKRKSAAMDDSGYFSSLDSSATRPFANPKLPDLKVDQPRIKRGRAEEEIARIRSSSHDISPSRCRSLLKQPTPSLVSSSPLRHLDSSLMLPPLTPAFKFKLPPKPPASISPNTNLRNHRNKIRELVGSPILKDHSLFSDEVSYSPAFNIVEDENSMFDEDFNSSFNIFEDNENSHARASSASPVKRSIRRPRVERVSKTANILADITGASLNSNPSLANLKTPTFDSPLKRKSGNSPLTFGANLDEVPKEDLFGLDLLDDEEPDDFGGLDILQGFQKIGGNQNLLPSANKASRPALGSRSHTSRF